MDWMKSRSKEHFFLKKRTMYRFINLFVSSFLFDIDNLY